MYYNKRGSHRESVGARARVQPAQGLLWRNGEMGENTLKTKAFLAAPMALALAALLMVVCSAPDGGGVRLMKGDDAYRAHIGGIREKLEKKGLAGFTIVLEKPFVVIGDGSPERVRAHAANTVRWAVRHLKKAYFEKDPDDIIDIWLFRNNRSYRKHAKLLFGDEPTTPYGYYSDSDKAMVMNIGTGGGTLVHEMVHAFVAANFPGCPTWFNEGLASLYEQCGERDGRIIGRTNWRLSGLKKAIRAGKVPSFKALAETTTHQFYTMDRGTNYGQARYLCYYLQEKGLLDRFYSEFRANVKADPTGYDTLTRVLGESDMDAFKRRWEAWVLTLLFRGN